MREIKNNIELLKKYSINNIINNNSLININGYVCFNVESILDNNIDFLRMISLRYNIPLNYKDDITIYFRVNNGKIYSGIINIFTGEASREILFAGKDIKALYIMSQSEIDNLISIISKHY